MQLVTLTSLIDSLLLCKTDIKTDNENQRISYVRLCLRRLCFLARLLACLCLGLMTGMRLDAERRH